MTNPNSFKLKQEPPKQVQEKLKIPPPSTPIGKSDDDFLKGSCPYGGSTESCESCS